MFGNSDDNQKRIEYIITCNQSLYSLGTEHAHLRIHPDLQTLYDSSVNVVVCLQKKKGNFYLAISSMSNLFVMLK